jgi:transposase
MLKAILGIDVAKLKLDVELMLGEKVLKRKFDNNNKGFKMLQGWLTSLHVNQVHACLEATGTYGDAVAEFLHEHGHRVSVVNPFQIKFFAKSSLKRNKTDKADAHTIATFCLKMEPGLWQPLPPEVKQLRDLVRRLEALERMLQMETNRRAVASVETRPSIDRMIKNFKKEIDNVQRLIKDHINNNPVLKHKSKLLRSIPGIGEKTARLLLAEIESRKFTSGRALAAHGGVTPGRHQSGTSIDWTKLSKLGSSRLRKGLYFPAITALRYNEIIKQFAKRLDRHGKTSMQIICAAMRKLLHIAYGVIKHDRPFDSTLAIRA